MVIVLVEARVEGLGGFAFIPCFIPLLFLRIIVRICAAEASTLRIIVRKPLILV